MKVFFAKTVQLDQSNYEGVNVSIKVNCDIENFFQTMNVLKQGDPLSRIIFNLVADIPATLIFLAKPNGKSELSVIWYRMDYLSSSMSMILACFWTKTGLKLNTLIYCLLCFEQLSRLKINLYQSELFYHGATKDCEHEYTQLFGCKVGGLPLSYLVIPMNHMKLSNKGWSSIKVEEKF